jgi:ZIP family zinc transporter
VSAFVLEFLFLGLSISADVGRSGARCRAVGVTAGVAATALLGAVGGAALLSGASHVVLGVLLAFGAVALMYLVTEELLVEAHEGADPPWAAAMFFVGFLIYLVIQELAR